MKRSFGTWQFFGFAVTSLGGTILHFLYDWLGESKLVAPFSGVNESTWEHMKLLFFPMLLFAVAERFFFRESEIFWCIKVRGILLGLLLIPVLFYTYNGAIGKSPDWINITIFFISAAVAYLYETRLWNNGTIVCRYSKLALILPVLIAVSFVVFTFFTPEIGIFKDPISGSYGI
jgi:hypothetical protein